MTINHLRRWHAAQRPGGRRRSTETIDKYLEEMRGGEVLCRQHSDGETRYWLTPSQRTIRRDIAEQLICRDELVPMHDGLFGDNQTWRAR